MTPEEKIEALRGWAASSLRRWLPDPPAGTYYDESSPTWFAGYACARDEVRDIIDPPKPKWREMVDRFAREQAQEPYDKTPLSVALGAIADIDDKNAVAENLADLVALCEAQVGDGWQADPDSQDVLAGSPHVLSLLLPLAVHSEPFCWQIIGDRCAFWLRSLTDGGEHTLGPYCPVCSGDCGGAA